MTPHDITIEHPARIADSARPAKELAAACPPWGDLSLLLPDDLFDLGLVGGALRLASVRGALVSRVVFLSPRALEPAELTRLQVFVTGQLLDGIGADGIDVEGVHVELGLVGARPGQACQKAARRPSKSRPLLPKAAREGDLSTVRRALVLGEPADSRDKWGQTVLSLAAGGGHEAVVDALLSAGADPDGQWQTAPHTPLSQAATAGVLPIVERLLAAGAGVDIRPAKRDPMIPDFSALGWACSHGHHAVVAALLHAGADPNLPDRQGRTALHCARPGDLALLDRLIAGGADPMRRDEAGRTPLEEALHQASALENPQWADPEAARAHRAKADRLRALTGPA